MINNKELYKLHADFCKLMANPKRIEILYLLGESEMCVDEIAKAMECKIPNISQHLSVMREKNVVKVRRDGTKMYYTLIDQKTLKACKLMREAMIEQMQNQINMIKNVTGT